MADGSYTNVVSTDGSPWSQPPKVDGGGGPPHDSDMERRIASLEAKMDAVQTTLNAIQVTLARMEEKLASKEDVHKLETRTAVLEERTTKLASTRGVAGMLALATAAIALVSKWSEIFGYLTHHP